MGFLEKLAYATPFAFFSNLNPAASRIACVVKKKMAYRTPKKIFQKMKSYFLKKLKNLEKKIQQKLAYRTT
jgi:hypothetical protein